MCGAKGRLIRLYYDYYYYHYHTTSCDQYKAVELPRNTFFLRICLFSRQDMI